MEKVLLPDKVLILLSAMVSTICAVICLMILILTIRAQDAHFTALARPETQVESTPTPNTLLFGRNYKKII